MGWRGNNSSMGHSRDRPANSRDNARVGEEFPRDRARLERILDACARGALVLDPDRRIVFATAAARRWMISYFGDSALGDTLPEALDLWVRQHEATVRKVLGLPRPRSPLLIERGARRLVLRLVGGQETIIVLEEQRERIDADSLRALPLSRREREILAEVANGSSNAEVGRALDISVRTVEAHVLHICARLRVHSRIAAASRAFAEWRIALDNRAEGPAASDLGRRRRRGAKR